MLSAKCQLLHFFMRRVLTALAAEFIKFQPARRRLLVFRGGVVAVLAVSTLQRNNLSRHLTVPSCLPCGLRKALSASKRGNQQGRNLRPRRRLFPTQ